LILISIHQKGFMAWSKEDKSISCKAQLKEVSLASLLSTHGLMAEHDRLFRSQVEVDKLNPSSAASTATKKH